MIEYHGCMVDSPAVQELIRRERQRELEERKEPVEETAKPEKRQARKTKPRE